MFCTNCGAECKEGALFCTSCGARLGAPAEQPGNAQTAEAPNQGQPVQMVPPVQGQPVYAAQQAQPVKKTSGKTLGIILGCVGAAVIVCIAVIAFFLLRKPTANLNKYLSVTFEGYDTVGRAQVEFDEDAFRKDFGKKLKPKSGTSRAAAQSVLDYCIQGSLSEASGLSNGDEVTFTWNCDDETALERYGCKLKYKDQTYKVADLEVAETFDPFDGIEVRFDGIAPDGVAYAILNSSDPAQQDLDYDFDKETGLSNGDEITLYAGSRYVAAIEEYMIEHYGRLPSPMEKTYTVEGLRSYARTIDEIPGETLSAMQRQAEDVLQAIAAQNWNRNYASLEKLELQTLYLLTPKEGSGRNGNIAYLVYGVQPHVTVSYSNYSKSFMYYNFVRFENIILDGQGGAEVNLNDTRTAGNHFYFATGARDRYTSEVQLSFYGYETLSELYTDAITAQIDQYTVQEKAADAAGAPSGAGAASGTENDAEDESGEGEAVGEAGIIFPDSSTRRLSEEEVAALTDEELRYAINELYARNGYIFKDDALRAYYEQFDWYTPSTPADDFKQSQFSDVEKANIELMQKERDRR